MLTVLLISQFLKVLIHLQEIRLRQEFTKIIFITSGNVIAHVRTDINKKNH